MQTRHTFLWNTIGYLNEEESALINIRWISCASTVALIVGTILQWYFFSLYNHKFHPFKDILNCSPGNEYTFNYYSTNFFIFNLIEKVLKQMTTIHYGMILLIGKINISIFFMELLAEMITQEKIIQ